MAFLAPLVEAGAEAGAAGEAAGGATEGGGLMSKVGSLFSKPGKGNPNTEQPNRQNVGDSRVGNFMDAANQVRSALRGTSVD